MYKMNIHYLLNDFKLLRQDVDSKETAICDDICSY